MGLYTCFQELFVYYIVTVSTLKRMLMSFENLNMGVDSVRIVLHWCCVYNIDDFSRAVTIITSN